MRIIAGVYKGRALTSPPATVRPIPVLLRKSLFDIVRDRVRGCRFLDGFAGSGIVGIEALSRGAASVDFIESDEEVLEVLRRNLDRLGASQHAHLCGSDLRAFLATTDATWDIIFADPPYAAAQEYEWLGDPRLPARLTPGGLIILKAPVRWKCVTGSLSLRRVKKQGENALFFLGAP